MKRLALLLTVLAACGCSSDDGPSAKMCLEACSVAADCVTTGTTEEDWKCRGARCDFIVCTNDSDCIALRSDWSTPCTAGGNECAQNWVCISVGGGGMRSRRDAR